MAEKNQKIKKRTALLTLIIMILNLFYSYIPLFNTVKAAVTLPEKTVVMRRCSNIKSARNGKTVQYEVAIAGDIETYGFDIKFSVDTTKLVAGKSTGDVATTTAQFSTINGYFGRSTAVDKYDATAGTVRLQPSTGESSLNAKTLAEDEGVADTEEFTKYDGYFVVYKLTFKLVDETLTVDDLDSMQLFEFVKIPTALETGFKYGYDDNGTAIWVTDRNLVDAPGFPQDSGKNVDSISITKDPNLNYEHGDTIKPDGGKITVTYDDNSKEEIDMTSSGIEISPKIADINSCDTDSKQEITVKYEGKTTTYKVSVTDPITSVTATNTNPTKSYDHDQAFTLSDVDIKVTKKSGATINNLKGNSTGVTASLTTANVNDLTTFNKTSAEGVVPVSGTQTVKFTYDGIQSNDIIFLVNDTVTGILVKNQPTKKVYKRDETLDLTGAQVKITLGSGGTSTVNLPNGSITVGTYNPTDTTNLQHLSVAFGTIPASDTIDVEAYDYIDKDSVTLRSPTNLNPDYGKSLDLSGGKMTFKWKSQKNGEVNLTDCTISGYTSTELNQQTITAKYDITYTTPSGQTIPDSISKTFTVNVKNNVTGISIQKPTEDTYNHGVALDLTGGLITVTYANGDTDNPTMTTSMIKEEDGSAINMSPASYDNTNKISKTLKITYEEDGKSETIDYPITIVNNIESIKMHATPKTKYNINETFTTKTDAGVEGEIRVTRAVQPEGTTYSVLSLTDTGVSVDSSAFSSTSANPSMTINVSYTENDITKSTSYTVSVEDIVTGIALKGTPKTVYKYNEELETLKLDVTSGSGTNEVTVTSDMISGYTKTDLGPQTVTISYGTNPATGQPFTEKINVVVKDYVTGIKLNKSTATGTYNDTLDDIIKNNDLKYIITYAKKGDLPAVTVTENMISGYSPTNTDLQSLPVTYIDNDNESFTKDKSFSATPALSVTLTNTVTGVEVTAPTATQIYNHGGSLNLSGAKIILKYADGTSKDNIVIPDASMVFEKGTSTLVNMTPSASDFGTNTTITKQVTLKYTYGTGDAAKSDSIDFPITIKNNITKIEVGRPTDTKYNINASTYKLAGGKIFIYRAANGTTATEINMLKEDGTLIDELSLPVLSTLTSTETAEGTTRDVNLTYTEDGVPHPGKFGITVVNGIVDAKIKKPTAITFEHKDPLIFTEGKIELTKANGDKTNVDIDSSMVKENGATVNMEPAATEYDENNELEKTLTISYTPEGWDTPITDTYKITIKNTIKEVSVTKPTNTDYKIKDTTSLEGGKFIITRKAGNAEYINLTDTEKLTVTGFETTTAGENKTATVTYIENGKSYPETFKYNVRNGVDTIVITAPTNDEGTKFEHGDTLTFGNGTIVVTYLDKTTKNVPITSGLVKETLTGNSVNMTPTYEGDYKTNKKITKNITIEYTEDGVSATPKAYDILITNPIKTIEFNGKPKNEFKVNEEVTNKGAQGKIKITRKSNDIDEIAITGTMIENDINTSVEVSNVPNNVIYQDPLEETPRKVPYTYSVLDGIGSVAVVVPTAETDLVFNRGDAITYSSGAIQKTSLSGTPSSTSGFAGATIIDTATGLAPTTELDYSKFNEQNEATINISVTYTEPTNAALTDIKTYTIKVINNVTAIDIDPEPTNKTYNVNETEYDLSGGKLKIARAVGPQKTIDLDEIDFTADGNGITDLSTLTNATGSGKTVTITYGGQSDTFNIDVVNGITGVTITPPTKTSYEHGDELDLTNGNVVLHYADGTSSENPIPLDKDWFSENGGEVNMSPDKSTYDPTTYTQVKTLKITYTDVNGVTYDPVDYTFTLENVIDHLEYVTTPKSTYNLKEAITYPIGTIKTVRKAGDKSDPIDITSDMVTNLSTENAEENKKATITYAGKPLEYIYSVVDFVDSVQINVPTNDEGTKFFHGDAIGFGNGTIVVNYKGGDTPSTPITSGMDGLTITEVVDGQEQELSMHPLAEKYGTDNTVTKTIKLHYEKDGKTDTKTYTITLINYLTGIEVQASNQKYNIGDTDLQGVTVKMYRAANGTTEVETVNLPDARFEVAPELSTLTSTSGTGKPVTVTYKGTDVKETQSDTFTIDVEDRGILSAEVQGAQTNYKVGDNLNKTQGNLVITRNNGATESYPLNTEGMSITGFDSTAEKIGQTLTVTYTKDGETFTATYTVNITNAIQSISLSGPSKKTYKYGQELDLSDAQITVTDIHSQTKTIDVKDNMISGYTKEPGVGVYPQTQTVTVTYGKDIDGNDVTATFQVTLEDYVKEIEVVNAKETYEYNESGTLDLTQGQVNITMASGTPTTAIDLNDTNVKVDETNSFNPTQIGTQPISVSYGTDINGNPVTTTYNVTVEPKFLGVEINIPTKTEYCHSEPLELTTGNIIIKWAGKDNETKNIESSMVTEVDGKPVNMEPSTYDNTNKVQKTLKIKYEYTEDGEQKEVTENYPITIINKVTSIAIKEEPKKNYNYGDTIDKTIGSIKVTRANGEVEEIALTDSRITIIGFDTSKQAKNIPVKVEFTENGVTKPTNYTITVKDDVSDIQIVGTPKTTYKYGENLDLTGVTLTVTRPSGVTTGVKITQDMISGYKPDQLGEQNVTISYGEKTKTFKVNVKDYLKDIELVKPSTVTYKLNEPLDLTGASITEVMASGTKNKGIQVTLNMVSEFDSSTKGTKTLTVTYQKEGKTFKKQFTVVVSDNLSGIRVKKFPIDEYLYGKTLDLTGAILEIETESGNRQEVTITSNMVSGYNPKPSSKNFEATGEYTQVITISYTKEGVTKKTTYPIKTKDYFDKIKVQGLEKEYIYGEDLKIDKATISKISASGLTTETVALTKDMISGYNKNQLGNQVLTIKYEGKTTTEQVNVKDKILAISINKGPNKNTYSYGSNIDITGAKLNVIKNSGSTIIDITKDMIIGYNPTKTGMQEITVKYAGFTAEFTVLVKEKVVANTVKTPVNKPIVQTPVVQEPIQEPKEERPVEQSPIVQKPSAEKPIVNKPVEQEPVEERNVDPRLIVGSALGLLAILFLLFLLANRKNVELYIEEEECYKLIGKDKLSRDNNQELDLRKYVAEYPNNDIEVVFNKTISKKLDGKTVIIKLADDKEMKIVVSYEKEEFIKTIEKQNTKETKRQTINN